MNGAEDGATNEVGTRAAAAFLREFGYSPHGVWSAPGRLNLIGEHTDYNDGFALPFALPHALAVAAAQRSDRTVRLRSTQEPNGAETRVDLLAPGDPGGWASYAAGALWVLGQEGCALGGLDVAVHSAIPPGAGLASSAALTCAVLLAAAELHGLELDSLDIARLAQRAENGFAGMPCGLMDQCAVLLGRRGHALFVDSRGPQCQPLPLELDREGLALLVIDSRAPHRLVGTEYRERRGACERAAQLLGVPALRDVGAEALEGALDALPPGELRQRVRHVVTENQRVLDAAALLRSSRIAEVGPLLTASHASLRDDYAVSVAETDTAVASALQAGALGARITGGGFGGCVLALVPADRSEACAACVRAAFLHSGFAPPHTFTASPADGAARHAAE